MTRTARIVAVLCVALATMSLGYAIKSQCLTHAWDGYQYRSSCYNDIYALYSFRGIGEGATPYLDGNGVDDGPDGDLEYPVGTGALVMVTGAIAEDGAAFFRLNAAALGIAGLLGIGLLATIANRRRIFLVAAAPPLALYAFHNWDLFALAFLCGGLVAWHRGRSDASALLLGIGAATKVFPGIALPALLLAEGRRRGVMPWRMVVIAAGSFAVVNVPLLIANPAAWFFPWRFQGERLPNFETHWYFLMRHMQTAGGSFWTDHYPTVTSVGSALAFGVGMLWLIRRENRRDTVRPFALAFMLMLWWLITAKVYSPQFSLWLLPFFALVSLPWRTYAAFAVSDAAVWFAISFFFLAEQGTPSAELRLWLVELATMARYAVLGWILWHVDHAEEQLPGMGRLYV